jgi:hypothetical protein
MSRSALRHALAAVATAALLVPAAAVAKPDKYGKSDKHEKSGKSEHGEKSNKPENDPGSGATGQTVVPVVPVSGKGGKNGKSYNVDGTVARVGAAESSDPLVAPDPSTGDDVVVDVTAGNSRGRLFAGQSVTFDLSAAVIVVADTNGDGVRNLKDVSEGDRVKVKLRLPRDGSGAQPFAAQRFEVKVAQDDDAEEPEVVTP